MGNGKAKGHVSACKRWSFMPPQNHLLQAETRPFTIEKLLQL